MRIASCRHVWPQHWPPPVPALAAPPDWSKVDAALGRPGVGAAGRGASLRLPALRSEGEGRRRKRYCRRFALGGWLAFMG